MITLTIEQAQKIEDVLWTLEQHNKLYYGETHNTVIEANKALSTIRAARAQEQAEQEPVAFIGQGLIPIVPKDLEKLRKYEPGTATLYDTPLYAAPQPVHEPEENPPYIPYTDEELEEAKVFLLKAKSMRERFAFIWETIYDHGNGKHLGALSRAQREVAWFYLQQIEDVCRAIEAASQPVQEPVAWVAEDVCDGQFINGKKRRIWWECIEGVGTPFYAAHVRTKDLTDDDLEKTYDEICRNASSSERLLFRYGRAVITKFKEKNK